MKEDPSQDVTLLVPVSESSMSHSPMHPLWRGWFLWHINLDEVHTIMHLAGIGTLLGEAAYLTYEKARGAFMPEPAHCKDEYSVRLRGVAIHNDRRGGYAGDFVQVEAGAGSSRELVQSAAYSLTDLATDVRLAMIGLISSERASEHERYPVPVLTSRWTNAAQGAATRMWPSLEKFWVVPTRSVA